MSVITLTTDFGVKDHYAAAVKGAIIRTYPEAKIIDISHHIDKHDTSGAAFVIKNCFREFPAGSVHLIGINEEASSTYPFLAVEAEGQFFIGTDNGVFSLILEDIPAKLIRIETNIELPTFPAKDVFVPAACHLARGGKLEDLGKPIERFNQKMELAAYVDQNSIRGAVIYLDSYGNAITNITRKHFEQIGSNRNFSIMGIGYEIKTISKTYGDVSEGEVVVIFNSGGNLEIALNKGSAADLVGLKHRLPIRIEFE
jgi:S-adenosyl-L-methionine hydrolase (adenosine-forming)